MSGNRQSGTWALRDARAHLGEVISKAKNEGPQQITVRGREVVVVLAVEEYRRMKGEPSGHVLVTLLHDSPLRHVRLERRAVRARVRDVAR